MHWTLFQCCLVPVWSPIRTPYFMDRQETTNSRPSQVSDNNLEIKQAWSGSSWPDPAQTGLIRFQLAWSGSNRLDPVQAGLIWFKQAWSSSELVSLDRSLNEFLIFKCHCQTFETAIIKFITSFDGVYSRSMLRKQKTTRSWRLSCRRWTRASRLCTFFTRTDRCRTGRSTASRTSLLNYRLWCCNGRLNSTLWQFFPCSHCTCTACSMCDVLRLAVFFHFIFWSFFHVHFDHSFVCISIVLLCVAFFGMQCSFIIIVPSRASWFLHMHHHSFTCIILSRASSSFFHYRSFTCIIVLSRASSLLHVHHRSFTCIIIPSHASSFFHVHHRFFPHALSSILGQCVLSVYSDRSNLNMYISPWTAFQLLHLNACFHRLTGFYCWFKFVINCYK